MTREQISARLAEIAPWPDLDPTPEAVARWLAVHAQREWAAHIIPFTTPGGPDHLDVAAVAKLNAHFAAAHALLALIGTGREEQAAREIALAWSGGSATGIWIWEHLEHLGADPDEVTRLEQARMALDSAEAKPDEARVKLAQAEALIGQLERITTAWTRGMYSARIDCWRGDAKAAAGCLSEGLDGYDGPEWNGTETGAEWWERTKAEEGW